MAFNNRGTPIWLDVGASVQWWYNNGNDSGAQYAMANCLTPDGFMQTDWEACELNDDGTVTYYVQFTNSSTQGFEDPNPTQPCFHNINGGGLT